MQTNTNVYTDFQGFTEMRKQAREETPESVKMVAKQFESLFVQMMLKSMRDTLPDDGLFSSNDQRMYQDMMDKQMSLNVSNGKGIGLADVIERQLTRTQPDVNQPRELSDYMQRPAAIKIAAAAKTTAMDNPYIEKSQSVVNEQSNWKEPKEFINDIWPHAVAAADELGVDPEVLVAQSALETGWGQYVRRSDNGQNSFSLFGIKAQTQWQGDKVSVSTLEFRNGAMQREQAQFRAYGSAGEAFSDYVQFIKENPRYQQALEKGYDPDAYAKELQKAGYATDPDYAKKIERIRNSDLLQTNLSELKNGTQVPLT
jgi:peptidoglycan hydrolase FlgJ